MGVNASRWLKMMAESREDIHGKHAVEWFGADPKSKDFKRKRNIVKIVTLSLVDGMTVDEIHANLRNYTGETVSRSQIEDMALKFSRAYPDLRGRS
jgi:DNA polymerase I-like protein with 3'-5' exonuclease and polymerase domains